MDIIKFFYKNWWDGGTLVAAYAEPNFPAENTQHRDFNKAFRSLYSPGSTGSIFEILAGVNDRLDFKDSGNTTRVATLAAGGYTRTEILAHLKARMEAVCADTFTWEYIFIGIDAYKFKVIDATGNFELSWNTGANKAQSVANTIGYDDSADDTGAANYTADNIRIHSWVYVARDFGQERTINAVAIRGHNFQSGATISAQFSSDNFITVHANHVFTTQDDILVLILSSPENYQHGRIVIEDADNPDGYVKMGRVGFLEQFQPEINFMGDGSIDREDPSPVLTSENGQESSIQLDHFDTWDYIFHVKGATEKAYFDAMFDAVGKSKAFFYCEDPDLLLTTTRYVAINAFRWAGRRDVGLWTLSLQLREQR